MSLILRWPDVQSNGLELPNVLEFDTLVSEAPSDSAQVTTSPVEKGFAISDGVTPAPSSLRLEGIITDRSIRGQESQRLQVGRTESAREQLRALKNNGTLLNIETDSRLYENYVLKSFESARTGRPDSIQFSMSFVEIRIVETQTQATPTAVAKSGQRVGEAKPKGEGGKAAGIQETDKSAAAALVDSAAGWLK